MAWKPWYQRAAELDSDQERVEFIRGVFGPGQYNYRNPGGTAAVLITGVLAGWGIGSAIKKSRKR